MNTFGSRLRLTTFGESHGVAIGGVIDGMPARMPVDYDAITRMMAERRPGVNAQVSGRREPDEVRILSGVSEEGLTLGSPIAFIIENTDTRSADYEELRHTFRPNHADMTWQMKYGIRDHRGGGRASARETAVRVAAAAIVSPLLGGMNVKASLISVGGCSDKNGFAEVIDRAKREQDSVGGMVECVISRVPVGLGEPIFDKLQAKLAYAMMSIPGVKAFEYGDGMKAAAMRGAESADIPYVDADGTIRMRTNHSGGIQGGISNGEDIVMRVAFKPTASIARALPTVTDDGREVMLSVKGRHDPCIAVRGVAVVKAMAMLVMADALLTR